MHRVVVEARGSVAEVTHNSGAMVEVFDWDDIAEYASEEEMARIKELIRVGKTITAGDYRRELLRKASYRGEEINMPEIRLYEDNGGTLYLWREGDYEAVARVELALPGVNFRDDAEDYTVIHEDVAKSEPESPNRIQLVQASELWRHPETRCVALYEAGEVTVLESPGGAAKEYLAEDYDGE